jgi:hypothetical protein
MYFYHTDKIVLALQYDLSVHKLDHEMNTLYDFMLLGSKNNCNVFRTSWNEYQHLYTPNSFSFKYML